MTETIAATVINTIHDICARNKTTLESIRRTPRNEGKNLTALKQIARYLREYEFWSYSDIGDYVYCDKSTVIYHLKD